MARATVRTVTGGVALRLLGLAVLGGLWLILSAARADADVQLPVDPPSAPVAGALGSPGAASQPAPAPSPPPPDAAAVADQVAGTVDRTTRQVSGTVDRTAQQVSGTVDRTSQGVTEAVGTTTDGVTGTVRRTTTTLADDADAAVREVTRQADGAVRDVTSTVDRTPVPAPVAPAPGPPDTVAGPASDRAASGAPPARPHKADSPVPQGDPRGSRTVDVVRSAVASPAADSDSAAHAQPVAPMPLPVPLQVPATVTAAAGAGSSGPLQQLLLVAVLGAAVLLMQGSFARVAVPAGGRPRALTLQPGTSPD